MNAVLSAETSPQHPSTSTASSIPTFGSVAKSQDSAGTVAAFPRPVHQAGTPLASSPTAAAKPQASSTRDSLLPEGGKNQLLQIDPKTDGVSSKVHDTASTTNAVMLLKEGVMLSGTHYGLTLISESGVVIIDKNAKILPSSTKSSCIYAKRLAVLGEAVVARLQAEETLLLCESAKVLADELVYGRTFYAADGNHLHIKHNMRRLLPREPRVEAMLQSFQAEMNGGIASFDHAVQQEEERLDNQG